MSYLDIARACDRWLAKNVPQYVPGGTWGKRFKPEPVAKKTSTELETASSNKGSIRVERDPDVARARQPRPTRAKYASKEERDAATRARMIERWKSMDPKEKQERIKRIQEGRGPKSTVPRHKRPNWLKYKRAWYEKNKHKPLTEEQIQKRREGARRRYHATDPEIRAAKNKIRRQKYGKGKTKKEKGL